MDKIEKTIKAGLVISLVVLFLIVFLVVCWKLYKFFKLKKQRGRGKEFENEFARYVGSWAAQNNVYYLGPNLYKYNGKLFEIDGILISNNGIIVIETKSIRGNISGDYNNKNWYKVFSNTSYEISNALQQNDNHIKHLEEILRRDFNIYSFIIFEDFKNTIQITNVPEWAMVFKEQEFDSKMSLFMQETQPLYTDNDTEDVYKNISSCVTKLAKDKAIFKGYRS